MDSEEPKISWEDYEFARRELDGIENKRGFEAYKVFRNFFTKLRSEPEREKTFFSDGESNDPFKKLQFLDDEYIENFNLSLSTQSKYFIKAFDKRIKPRGIKFNQFYKECGGLLTLFLRHYESISERQAFNIVTQLTRLSVSTIKKSYYQRIRGLKKDLKEELPPPFILSALYWALHSKGIKLESVRPIFTHSTASKGKNQETIAAYWRFTEKVARFHQEKILQYLEAKPLPIVPAVAKAYGIAFPLSEDELKKPDAFSVCFLAMGVHLLNTAPAVIEELDRKMSLMS